MFHRSPVPEQYYGCVREQTNRLLLTQLLSLLYVLVTCVVAVGGFCWCCRQFLLRLCIVVAVEMVDDWFYCYRQQLMLLLTVPIVAVGVVDSFCNSYCWQLLLSLCGCGCQLLLLINSPGIFPWCMCFGSAWRDSSHATILPNTFHYYLTVVQLGA